MKEEIVYMLGIVAAGFAVNFGLRALPFVIFSFGGRNPPRWIERFGSLISPVIISALVVYSYAGLAWRIPAPYIAGAATIALQLWRRNPLVSIIAGTALYMLLLSC